MEFCFRNRLLLSLVPECFSDIFRLIELCVFRLEDWRRRTCAGQRRWRASGIRRALCVEMCSSSLPSSPIWAILPNVTAWSWWTTAGGRTWVSSRSVPEILRCLRLTEWEIMCLIKACVAFTWNLKHTLSKNRVCWLGMFWSMAAGLSWS